MTHFTRLLFGLSASVAVVLGSGLTGGLVAAQGLQKVRHAQADAAIENLYKEKSEQIGSLTRTVLDRSAPADSRVAAFRSLRINYPRMAFEPAVKIASDEQSAVALEGVQFLAASIVMMDHGGKSQTVGHHDKHDKAASTAIIVLRKAVMDPRPEIMDVAAGALASFSDREALDMLRLANRKQKISDLEAVKYYTLAKPAVGAAYVADLLGKSSVEVQSEAISYLSPLGDYQPAIRDKFLFNESAPIELRIAAARSLARSDTTFGKYAGKLVSDPKLPAPVFDALMTDLNPRLEAKALHEIFSKAVKTPLDVDKRATISRSLERLEASRPDLQGSLRQYNPI